MPPIFWIASWVTWTTVCIDFLINAGAGSHLSVRMRQLLENRFLAIGIPMLSGFKLACSAVVICFAVGVQAMGGERTIRDGKLFVDGKWVFLKIGKPLRDFSKKDEVDQLIRDLDVI